VSPAAGLPTHVGRSVVSRSEVRHVDDGVAGPADSRFRRIDERAAGRDAAKLSGVGKENPSRCGDGRHNASISAAVWSDLRRLG
jgi:hypothetical protein